MPVSFIKRRENMRFLFLRVVKTVRAAAQMMVTLNLTMRQDQLYSDESTVRMKISSVRDSKSEVAMENSCSPQMNTSGRCSPLSVLAHF